jgi:hypothetical protein
MIFLTLGIANGATGPIRPNATTGWQAEYCPNWMQNFSTYINYKHADCDGDGNVNINLDQNAITANYGFIHNKKDIKDKGNRGMPPLYINTSGVVFAPGTTVELPIMIGNANSIIYGFYGIASTLEVVNGFATNGITVDIDGSWISAANLEKFNYKIGNARNEFAIIKNNHMGSNGFGQIGKLKFTISPNAQIGNLIIFEFLNTKVVTSIGSLIDIYAPGEIGVIAYPNGIQNAKFDDLNFSPNPATSNLQVISKNKKSYLISLKNILGATLAVEKCSEVANINVAFLSRGIYLLQIQDSNGNIEMRKVSLQ